MSVIPTTRPHQVPTEGDPPGLVGPDDPPAFQERNPEGRAPVLVLADHAGNALPGSLGRLGLQPEQLDWHIAYDPGIDCLFDQVIERLDAPGLRHGYSRLIIDPNRRLDDPTSICVISDGVIIPANRGLSAADVADRAAAFFHPYHQAIDARLNRFLRAGQVPALVSLHSFTPVMRGFRRPWQVGVMWAEDGRIAEPLIAALRAQGLCVGDNEPYSGRTAHGFTVESHAIARGLPNVLIEVRQDLIETRDRSRQWGDRLADALAPILADPALYRTEAAA